MRVTWRWSEWPYNLPEDRFPVLVAIDDPCPQWQDYKSVAVIVGDDSSERGEEGVVSFALDYDTIYQTRIDFCPFCGDKIEVVEDVPGSQEQKAG